MSGRRILFALALIAAGGVVGFAMALGVIDLLNLVLPPFRPEDDDTLREFIPAALAYATWVITALLVFVVSWRRVPAE